MDHLLGGSKPSLDAGGIELFAKPAKRILATEASFAHSGDLGDRHIVLKPSAVRKTGAANQTVQREGLEDVANRGGVQGDSPEILRT